MDGCGQGPGELRAGADFLTKKDGRLAAAVELQQ
jgi:hypothetical protein